MCIYMRNTILLDALVQDGVLGEPEFIKGTEEKPPKMDFKALDGFWESLARKKEEQETEAMEAHMKVVKRMEEGKEVVHRGTKEGFEIVFPGEE